MVVVIKTIKVDDKTYKEFKYTCVKLDKKIHECLDEAMKMYIQSHSN